MDMHFGSPAARSTPRPHQFHFAVYIYCICSFLLHRLVSYSSIDSDGLQHFRTTSSITFRLVIHGAYRFPSNRLRFAPQHCNISAVILRLSIRIRPSSRETRGDTKSLLFLGGVGQMWRNVQGYWRGVRVVAAFLGTVVMISFWIGMSNAGVDRPMQALGTIRMGLR